MANVTISQIANEVTSPAADDWIEIEENSTGTSGKIKKSNLLGALLTGGGTLATGGFTLTVPATGTAALLGTAQTFSGAKTFSSLITADSGVTFGDDTLSMYDEGTWTPVTTGSSSNPSVSYTSREGHYTRIGNMVFYGFFIRYATFSGGSGNLTISLPVTVGSGDGKRIPGAVVFSGFDMPGTDTTASISFLPTASDTTGTFRVSTDDGSQQALSVSAVDDNDFLYCGGFYFT